MKTRPMLLPAAELLARLVRCPSTGGPAGHGEAGMVALLADFLEPWADHITITEPAPGRLNLVALFNGLERTRSYALEAHSGYGRHRWNDHRPFYRKGLGRQAPRARDL